MSTQIKRLQLSGSDFVPITLSEAVVVNCSSLPGLQSLGITTLERVLRTYLGIMGTNAEDIEKLEQLLDKINTVLENKLDKLIPGNGIEILPNGVINATFSTTLYEVTITLPQPPSSEHMNKIYIVPDNSGLIPNVYNEYICVLQENNYYWELIGSVTAEIDLSEYLKAEIFYSYIDTLAIQAIDITSSKDTGNKPIILEYTIPETIYDYLIL